MACCALRIFDAATICIARVICAVLLIDLMRRRMSRRLGITSPSRSLLPFHVCLNSSIGRLQLGLQRVAERLFLPDLARATLALRVVRKSVSLFWNSLTRSTGT